MIFIKKIFYKDVSLFVFFDKNTVFSKTSKIFYSCRLWDVKVGNYTQIRNGCEIWNTSIGHFTTIARYVIIGVGAHPLSSISPHPIFYKRKSCSFHSDWAEYIPFDESKPCKIGNDVWIGLRSIIMDGVSVGDGPMKSALEKYVEENDLKDNVWFYGETYSEEEISMVINSADLCVSPGNVGLTAMHSLTYGTPVITHDKFELQMPEFEAITKGVSGDFYQYGSVESLASTISQWFKKHPQKDKDLYLNCTNSIDTLWNPLHQISILKSIL